MSIGAPVEKQQQQLGDPRLGGIALTGHYSIAEEITHAITHGVGILLSIAALTILVAFAALRGDAWHIVSCSIYGSSLVLLYTASTLYHALPAPRAKGVFRTLDHAAIYVLIAGTYTPFTLVNLRGGWGCGGWPSSVSCWRRSPGPA
jgi:hemolysin III